MDTATRIERVDYRDLNSGEIEWGAWNANLEDNVLYDLVTLLSKFFLMDELKYVPPEVAKFCQTLYHALQVDHGVRASLIGRPLEMPAGPMCIVSLLKQYLPDVFEKPPTESVFAVIP